MSEHATDTALKRLRRSRSNRVLAGVSGGLGEYFELHPAVFRVAFVVLTLLGGAGILIYLAAALVMPDEGREDSIATAALRGRRDRPWPLIGLGLVVAAGAAVLSEVSVWPHGDAWAFLLVAGALILWLTHYGVSGEKAADASPRAAEDARRVRRLRRRLAIAAAAIVAVLLLLGALVAAAFDVQLRSGVGERTYALVRSEDLRSDYRLGLGELRLDLRSLDLPAGETRVEVRVDIGELWVLVPPDVALRVDATSQLGEIRLPGEETVDGYDVEADLDENGARVLVVDAHVGLGSLQIIRAVP
jgi:phage shock protein PspC (stress-responsive transcriptional regulator)